MNAATKRTAMLRRLFPVWLVVAGIAACGNPQPQNKPAPETPKALKDEQEASYRMTSKRRGGDLLERLYDELLEKDSSLRKLEDNIQELQESEDDSTEAFHKFDNKNSSYYDAAKSHLGQISDSALKLEINRMVANSLAQYQGSIAGHKALLKRIKANAVRLHDLHIILKITRTLAVIEAYQKDALPSTSPLEDFTQKQQAAIKTTDSLAGGH